MKCELVEWLCIDLTIGMVWVRTLVNSKLALFFTIVAWIWKGRMHEISAIYDANCKIREN